MRKLFILIGIIASLFLTSQQALGAYSAKSDLFGGTYANFGEYFANALLPHIITIASVGAVLMIAIAGFKYVSSGGAPDAVNESKGYIIGAIVGIAVIVFAMAFVNIFFGEAEFSKITTKKIENMNSSPSAPPGGGTSGGEAGTNTGGSGTAGGATAGGSSAGDSGDGVERVECPSEVATYGLSAIRYNKNNSTHLEINDFSADILISINKPEKDGYAYRFYINEGTKQDFRSADFPAGYFDNLNSDNALFGFVNNIEKVVISSKAFKLGNLVNGQYPFCDGSKQEITIPAKLELDPSGEAY